MNSLFKKGVLALSTASLLVLLAGCASTPEECDPSQDQGFFGKIGCSVSGAYGERINQKEQQLADLTAEHESLVALTNDLVAKDTLVKASYQDRMKELKKVSNEINSIEKSLKEKSALSSDLQMQINDVKNQIANMQSSGSSETLRKKQAQAKELQRVLDDLKNQIENESL